MRTLTKDLSRVVVAVVLAAAIGCGDDEVKGNVIDAGSGSDASAACQSFDTENERLLNAPTSATVVHKSPNHPPVGDGGLP